jgi:N-acetylmuramoyl-L-alanine amidase
VTVDPRSTHGQVWEVDKARQLLVLARDGALEWVFHTSTGTEQPYTYRGRELLADTPPGHHEVEWHVDGWRDGALGRLYRPRYFHPDGIAIHGYRSVPSVPASHGCVRVTLEAMDFIWREGLAPLGTRVWVYGETPAV